MGAGEEIAGEGSDLKGRARESARGCAQARNGADGAVPLGREGEGEGAGHGADRWGPPVSGRAGERLAGLSGPKGWDGGTLGFFSFFFYSEFPNSFPFCFSLLDSNSNMLQIQIIQTCASNKRII
jgi:hypothetical protein